MMTSLLALAVYVGSIVAANWFVGHVGVCLSPEGPCLLPVGWGLMAPSGVLWVGLALFARDVVQDRLGRRAVFPAIAAGAALSWALASPALALASGAAFLVSETADWAVYTPLRRAGRHAWAVLASGAVGGLVDSVVFLGLAFGSLALVWGQWVGKTEVAIVCAALVAAADWARWSSWACARCWGRPERFRYWA